MKDFDSLKENGKGRSSISLLNKYSRGIGRKNTRKDLRVWFPNLLKAQQKHQCQQEAKTQRKQRAAYTDFWRAG